MQNFKSAEKKNPKMVIFKTESVSYHTFENESNQSPKNEDGQNAVDDFKNTLSSFWTFNPEFFGYPAISFDKEGMASWTKIIEENIFQPFLPKNRLILQHIVKGSKEEQQRKFAIFDDRKDFQNPTSPMSPTSPNSPTSPKISISHIEKILGEIRKRMDKKMHPPQKPSKARKFELRSYEHSNAFLRKKENLRKEEAKLDLLNHQLYHLDLSLQDIGQADYFKLYDIEPESSSSKAILRTKRTREFSSKGLSHTTSKPEQPPNVIVFSNIREPVTNKKTGRKKSCCCSDCGGGSKLEKRILNFFESKEDSSESHALNTFDKRFLQIDSIPTLTKDKSVRNSRVVNSSTTHVKTHKEKEMFDHSGEERSAGLKPVKSGFEGLLGAERRKSINVEVNSTKNPNSSKKKPAIVVQAASSKGEVDNKQQGFSNTTSYVPSLTIPSQDNVVESNLNAQTRNNQLGALGHETKNSFSLSSRAKDGSQNKQNPGAHRKILKSQLQKSPQVTIKKMKKKKGSENIKTESAQIHLSEMTKGFSSLSDRSKLSLKLSQPMNIKSRKALSKVKNPWGISVKIDDLPTLKSQFYSQTASPRTTLTKRPAEPNLGIQPGRKLGFPLGPVNQPRIDTDSMNPSSPQGGLPVKTTESEGLYQGIPRITQKQEINKIYLNEMKKFSILRIPLATKEISSPSPLFSSVQAGQNNIDCVSPSSKVSLESAYRPTTTNTPVGQIRVKKMKPLSVATPTEGRTPTCP